MERIRIITGHLVGLTSKNERGEIISNPTRGQEEDPLPGMKNFLKHLSSDNVELVNRFYDFVKNEPFLKMQYGLDLEKERDLVLKQCIVVARFLVDNNISKIEDLATDPNPLISVGKALSLVDPSIGTKFGVQWVLCGTAILKLGTEKHHKLIPKMNTFETLVCFALTELGHGSNAREITTTAQYDTRSGEFIINTPNLLAQKYWMGNAMVAHYGVVFAQLQINDKTYGVHAFLVRMRDDQGVLQKGVYVEDCGHKQGLNGVDNGRIFFDNVRIPRDALLDKFGSVGTDGTYSSPIKNATNRFAAMIGALIGGRVSLTGTSLEVAKLGLTIAVRYATERTQFGPPKKPEIPIMDYLSHQRRLFPLLARTYALSTGERYVRSLLSNTTDTKHLHIVAAGMKALTTWNCMNVLNMARECCGGQGFKSDNRLGSLKQSCDIFTTYEGDNTVLLQQVAASLLKDFQAQFSKGKFFQGVFDYYKDEVYYAMESNSVRKRMAEEEHILSKDFHLQAFHFREKRSVKNLALTLKAKMKGGKSFWEAWNDSVVEINHAAFAHVENVCLKLFFENLEKEGETMLDSFSKDLLRKVIQLFALSTMEGDSGFFLEEGYFAPRKASAIRAQVSQLCKEIRPHAALLVDAFDVPKHLLPSIAKSEWVKANKFF
jgi:acyl-CoA oxidase